MSESDAVDTLLIETEAFFSDLPCRTAPTHSAMGDRGSGVIDTGMNHSLKLCCESNLFESSSMFWYDWCGECVLFGGRVWGELT